MATNPVNPVRGATSLVRVATATVVVRLLAVNSGVGISPVSRVKAVISLANPVRAAMVSRAVIRLVAISLVRVVTTPITPISPSNPLRRMVVPIRPTMTRMLSIV